MIHECMLLQEQEKKVVKIKWLYFKIAVIYHHTFLYLQLKKIISKNQARPHKWKSGIIITLLTTVKLLFSICNWAELMTAFSSSSLIYELILSTFSPFPHYLHNLRKFFSLRTNGNISRNTIKLCKPITGFWN